MRLVLGATDVGGPWQWTWVLRDEASGRALAEHQVLLNPGSAEVTAFTDLYEYVNWHVLPDRKDTDGARVVHRTGAWAGESLLGGQVAAAIAAASPVTVRVTVPRELDHVLLWPLELAHVDGKPLANRGDVGFVYDLVPGVGTREPDAGDAGHALRILAAFALPTGTGLVAVRRERYALTRLIRRVTEGGRAVELRVLQYGVTRRRLAEAVRSGDGWDVLHLSSHGDQGRFGLEKPDGSPDWVATADLMELLRPARPRVKLAVVTSCWSAAEKEAATPSRLLQLDGQAGAQAGGPGTPHVTGLARGLVRELDCAVVATRYQVTAEQMIDFAEVFYAGLLEAGEPVDVAAARALTAGTDESAGHPAYRVSPGLFGARAIGLTLPAPPAPPQADPAGQRMAAFPNEPERFVGHVATMAAAAAVLAPGSEKTVVALHGMPGAGASTCAVELAYRYQDDFTAVAYWRAPGREGGAGATLEDFAAALHAQFGVPLPSRLTSRMPFLRWDAYASRLSRVMRSGRLLLVMDDVDALLTPEGGWRDPWWGMVLTALASHGGRARLILAGRALPPSACCTFRVLPLGALPEAESKALLRELPALREKQWGRDPGDRARARELIRAAAGHPALLCAANGSAADLNAAEDRLGPIRDAVANWTRATVHAVSLTEARWMAGFLACLVAADRRDAVVGETWPRLWERLGRSGAPPEPGPLLDRLVGMALLRRQDGALLMHPAVAEAAREAAAQDIRDAADDVLADYWSAAPAPHPGSEPDMLCALPYLLRQQAYGVAADRIATALSPAWPLGSGQDAVPMLRQVAAETGVPAVRAALGLALWHDDKGKAQKLLEDVLAGVLAECDYRLSWILAGFLVSALWATGRLQAALELAEKRAGYARQAGLGPWPQLSGTAQRLLVEERMGRRWQVLTELDALLDRLDRLQGSEADSGGAGTGLVTPWTVREEILSAGEAAARGRGEWQRALDMAVEVIDGKRQRGTSPGDLARWQHRQALSLLGLGRLDEAAPLLADCQRAAERQRDFLLLAYALSGRAALEAARGDEGGAADLERASLRLLYEHQAGAARIAAAHRRLGDLLAKAQENWGEARAHRRAARLIYDGLTGGKREDIERLLVTLARDGQSLDETVLQPVSPYQDLVETFGQAASDLARLLWGRW